MFEFKLFMAPARAPEIRYATAAAPGITVLLLPILFYARIISESIANIDLFNVSKSLYVAKRHFDGPSSFWKLSFEF